MPYELMPAYFKRIDFEPNEKVSRKYIGDMSTLPGFHSGIEYAFLRPKPSPSPTLDNPEPPPLVPPLFWHHRSKTHHPEAETSNPAQDPRDKHACPKTLDAKTSTRRRTLETNTHAHFGPGSGVGPDFGLEGPTSFLKPTWLSPLSGPEVASACPIFLPCRPKSVPCPK
jgi:hypothetical protein